MLHLDQYDYDLPRELIAQWPLAERADARLLVVDRRLEQLEHRHIRDLPAVLGPGDCLVLNDTRVIPARVVGRRQRTGGFWQGLFLSTDADGFWQMLCKTRGRLVPGESIELVDRNARPAGRLNLYVKLEGGIWTARPDPDEPPLELLERIGQVPAAAVHSRRTDGGYGPGSLPDRLCPQPLVRWQRPRPVCTSPTACWSSCNRQVWRSNS